MYKKSLPSLLLLSFLSMMLLMVPLQAMAQGQTDYSYQNVDFSVPSDWEMEEDGETVYFYPEEGFLMLNYHEDASISDQEARLLFIQDLESSNEQTLITNEQTMVSSFSGQKGYLYDYETVIDQKLWYGKIFLLDLDKDFISWVSVASQSMTGNNVENIQPVLRSMGFNAPSKSISTEGDLTNYSIQGLDFAVPTEWEYIEKEADSLLYFYPEKGILTAAYLENIDIQDDQERQNQVEELAAALDGTVSNEQALWNHRLQAAAYLYNYEFEIDGTLWSGYMLLHDMNGDLAVFQLSALNNDLELYTHDFINILASMGFANENQENRQVNPRPSSNTIEETTAEPTLPSSPATAKPTQRAYLVPVNTDELYFLFDEKAQTVTIMASQNPDYRYESKYKGDFNNGIFFDWEGNEMSAHYQYWDEPDRMIIYDKDGNKNAATEIPLPILETYLNR